MEREELEFVERGEVLTFLLGGGLGEELELDGEQGVAVWGR